MESNGIGILVRDWSDDRLGCTCSLLRVTTFKHCLNKNVEGKNVLLIINKEMLLLTREEIGKTKQGKFNLEFTKTDSLLKYRVS